MPLSQSDRLAFSLSIINTDQQIAGLTTATAQMQQLANQDQDLDTANGHLFNPTNTLINGYQAEFNLIDGQIRTSIVEQNIIDAANKKLGNYFFPNNISLSIPSLSGLNNVWTQLNPFALAFGVGKNYDQTYNSGSSEQAFIASAQSLITSAGSFTDIQNTTGQHCVNGGSCSISMYLDQTTCEANMGIWTPTETIESYPAIQTLKTNLVSAINSIVSQAQAEATAITSIVDSDSIRSSQNTTELNYINNTLLPALNTWLSYQDFNTAHGQTTCAGFNGYNSNLLTPTKLHSTQLTVLNSVLSARSSVLSTRVSQLNTNLGSVSQDISTGNYTGSGFYKSRFDFLNLRINTITGSLTKLTSDQQSISAQTQIKTSLMTNKDTYNSVLPTTKLSASGNGTAIVSLVDSSAYSAGDTVYIVSDTQPELQFAIKSITGNSVQLNTLLPTKYTILDNVRFYKDIS